MNLHKVASTVSGAAAKRPETVEIPISRRGLSMPYYDTKLVIGFTLVIGLFQWRFSNTLFAQGGFILVGFLSFMFVRYKLLAHVYPEVQNLRWDGDAFHFPSCLRNNQGPLTLRRNDLRSVTFEVMSGEGLNKEHLGKIIFQPHSGKPIAINWMSGDLGKLKKLLSDEDIPFTKRRPDLTVIWIIGALFLAVVLYFGNDLRNP